MDRLEQLLNDAAGQLPEGYSVHIHVHKLVTLVTLQRPDESVDLINFQRQPPRLPGATLEECVKEAVRQAVSHAESANMEAADLACADKCRDQAQREDDYERQRRGE